MLGDLILIETHTHQGFNCQGGGRGAGEGGGKWTVDDFGGNVQLRGPWQPRGREILARGGGTNSQMNPVRQLSMNRNPFSLCRPLKLKGLPKIVCKRDDQTVDVKDLGQQLYLYTHSCSKPLWVSVIGQSLCSAQNHLPHSQSLFCGRTGMEIESHTHRQAVTVPKYIHVP